MKWLYATGKYDIAHYCTQATMENDPQLSLLPWPAFGSIPADQGIVSQLNADPQKGRNASYGSYNIDSVLKQYKPTIWVGSDDSWGFPKSEYADKPWWNKINSVLHITVDSLPIAKDQLEQAKLCKHYFTWAKFASDEMHRLGAEYQHVSHMYGAMNTDHFAPISREEKSELRKRFGIDESTTIFVYVFRNQLRKQAPRILEAFAKFKRDNPKANAKLLFHTSWSEMGAGWNIPERMAYYGIKREDVLCTYVCRDCGNWFIAPYSNENIDCPYCNSEKTCVTANIRHGVHESEMKYVYGIADAGISAFTSGGLEYTHPQTLLCGLPLACSNYSCGTDFVTEETKGFVTPIAVHYYDEASTNYIKATANIDSIAAYFKKICLASHRELDIMGANGREWAMKTFGIETIGPKWEKLFDSMPMVDWETIDLTKRDRKNDTHRYEDRVDLDELAYVLMLYKEVLLIDTNANDTGVQYWLEQLRNGVQRKDIHRYFVGEAYKDNEKNGLNVEQVEFTSILSDNGRKRALLVIPESIGDSILVTSLFKSFAAQYPEADLYVATKPNFKSVFESNQYVHKVLDYQQYMENELWAIGQGEYKGYFDYYLNPVIPTQRQLMYLSKKEPVTI
jgi:glycosyltransferase involved in cell wall biosynthesis